MNLLCVRFVQINGIGGILSQAVYDTALRERGENYKSLIMLLFCSSWLEDSMAGKGSRSNYQSFDFFSGKDRNNYSKLIKICNGTVIDAEIFAQCFVYFNKYFPWD